MNNKNGKEQRPGQGFQWNLFREAAPSAGKGARGTLAAPPGVPLMGRAMIRTVLQAKGRFQFEPGKETMKKCPSKKVKIVRYTLAVLLLVLVIWTIWGNTALTVSTIAISSNKIPASFSGFRIAQVSDLHNAEFGENNERLLKLLSEHEPDMIVITGDLVDARHTDIAAALDFVREAVQIAPVYYVTGNHEASLSQYATLKAGLEAVGVLVLEDEAVPLKLNGETVTLIGLSDPKFTSRGDMLEEVPAMVSAKLKDLIDGETSYTILLSHRPELFDSYAACDIDLVFSGHAHGGQFRLPLIGGLIAPNQGLFPKYDAGVFSEGNTDMIVSRGLGNSILPVRFNNRPEVVLVELNADAG